jgi:hypothetical protein
MTRSQLREELHSAQGVACGMPGCTNAWTDTAHIRGTGMGGAPSRNTVANVVGLCRSCHDTFDGRELAGRQFMLRRLMAEVVAYERAAYAKRYRVGHGGVHRAPAGF